MGGTGIDRRSFLKLVGGATALAAIPSAAPRASLAKLYPVLVPEKEIIPGTPYWFASTCRECPAGCGVMLKTRNGNVKKVEGNPNHPVSRGGLCPRGQAALQEVYSPGRLESPLFIGGDGSPAPLTWDDALAQINEKTAPGRTVFLSGRLTGSRRRLADRWLKSFGGSGSAVVHEPLFRKAASIANRICFGMEARNRYLIGRADYVLSFGADFMETWESPVELSRGYSEARRFDGGEIVKFVHIGSTDTLTAANADEEYKVPPGSESLLMLALARLLLDEDGGRIDPVEKAALKQSLEPFSLERASSASGLSRELLTGIAGQLARCGNPLVLCGDGLAAHERGTESQVSASILRFVAGCHGKTVSLLPRNDSPGDFPGYDLDGLIEDMESGGISRLFVYETDPLFTYPDRERLNAAMRRVPLKVALAATMNETASACDFALPVHHAIETWGLDEPRPGVFSLVQPATAPVSGARAAGEILLATGNDREEPRSFEDFIREEWESVFRAAGKSVSFEESWKDVLLLGGLWTNAGDPPVPRRLAGTAHDLLRKIDPHPSVERGLTLVVSPSHRFYDGRGSNKPWLWEMPDPLTGVVWDTPLRVHPEQAAGKRLADGDIVKVSANGRSIEAPVLLTGGVHPDVAAIDIGSGRAGNADTDADGTGNPLSLLPVKSTDPASGDTVLCVRDVILEKTGRKKKLVRLQGGYSQGARGITQAMPVSEAVRLHGAGAHREHHHEHQIYPPHEHGEYFWGMVIDLDLCSGCGACVVACYAENNIQVVGKEQCGVGREMAWLRIEQFEVGGRKMFLPMLCQQCENAPCEPVCPVYATVHSSDGLNVQVYNRCVGTRYCSNNCPYKVRRFNYIPVERDGLPEKQLNPDIYIRTKGIMEKCTFCVHRLRKAKEDAKIEGRAVRDGEAVPACAQSCPAGAITFGNLNDPESAVSKLKNDFRGYSVFDELNTQPSITYLKGLIHGS